MNNPDSPTLVNTMKLPMDDPVDLAADNGLLFVVGSQGPDGLTGLLQVIDISDPVHPVVLGYQNLPYQPQCLAVENGRIFVSFYPLWEHSTMDLHRGVMAMTYTGPKPPAPPQVTDLSRSEYAVGRLWPDSPVYADRTFKFTNAIPPELLGELYIRTCNDDKNLTTNPLLSFTVNRPVRVYVALNSGIATPPAWLKGWLRRAGQLMTTDVVPGRVLYYRDFAPGRITLGPNRDPAMALHKSMYTVVITPIVQNQSSVRGWKSYL